MDLRSQTTVTLCILQQSADVIELVVIPNAAFKDSSLFFLGGHVESFCKLIRVVEVWRLIEKLTIKIMIKLPSSVQNGDEMKASNSATFRINSTASSWPCSARARLLRKDIPQFLVIFVELQKNSWNVKSSLICCSTICADIFTK